jgi:hypothetical protein
MARMTYTKAIEWIVLEDDIEWLDDEDGSPSVTAIFLAEIYNVEVDQVTRALRKTRDRLKAAEKEKSNG